MWRCALGGKFEDPFAPTNTLAAKAPSFNARLLVGGRIRICYNLSSGSTSMRTANRIIAILSIAALLSPALRLASIGVQVQACACPPAACMCVGHRHSPGHVSICCLGNGGSCGMESHDNYLAALHSLLAYVATEFLWANPLLPAISGHYTSPLSLLPSHPRVPDQPPRLTV